MSNSTIGNITLLTVMSSSVSALLFLSKSSSVRAINLLKTKFFFYGSLIEFKQAKVKKLLSSITEDYQNSQS